VRDNFRKRRGWRSSENREWPDNALRHSFASCHLAHFKDAAVLALETGHTDSGMIFDHYREAGEAASARKLAQKQYWADVCPASRNLVLSHITLPFGFLLKA